MLPLLPSPLPSQPPPLAAVLVGKHEGRVAKKPGVQGLGLRVEGRGLRFKGVAVYD
jgi:hypothetical protein